MSEDSNMCPLILPFIIGIVLGIIAKFADGRDFMLHAAVRSFVFFIGMLSAYYGYTVLFLKFFPKSQMILSGIIAMVTPFCGFLIWHIHKENHYANFISSLPFTIFFTEWYLTAFTVRDWAFRTARDELLLGIAYVCFTLSLLAVVPTKK